MNPEIKAALKTIKNYCSERDCGKCDLADILGCVPSGGDATVPCNWQTDTVSIIPDEQKKLFELLQNEILDIDIKDCDAEITQTKIALLTARLIENGVTVEEPIPHTVCVECKQPIGSEEYYWTESRGYPPIFIHKRCYEKLLPKNKSSK